MKYCYLRQLLATLLLFCGSVTYSMADVATDKLTKPAIADTVEATLSAFNVIVNTDGKEKLLSADKIVPGNLLEYQVNYQNNGKSLVKFLTATLPLPVGMTYVANSAKPAKATASLDGKSFVDMPIKRMVKKENGELEEQLVPLSDYRALRWKLGDLSVKSKVVVSARVRVDSVAQVKIK